MRSISLLAASGFLLALSGLVACSSTAAVPCSGDAQCTPYGAVCVGGYCRLPKDLDLGVVDLGDDLLSLPDLVEVDGPVDLSPHDFSPMCTTSATCAPTTPICGSNGSCRACMLDDAAECLGRARTTPRCDAASGSCAACRPADEATDCADPAYSVCSTLDGSCRQPCVHGSDCASGVCDPGLVASTQYSCAWPDEVVYVQGATSCAGATGAQTSPLCTLDSALAKLPSGGFIRVLASSTALGQANTTITKPYVVVGDGTALVTIKGTQVVGPPPLHALYYPGAFTVGAGGSLYLEGVGVTTAGSIATCSVTTGTATLSLYNVYGNALNGYGVNSKGCRLTADRLTVISSSGGITITGGTIVQLSNAMIGNNTGTGLYIGAGTTVPGVGLSYLTFQDNNPASSTQVGGIDCEVPTTIVNTIAFLNGGSGSTGGAGGCVFNHSDVEGLPLGVGNTESLPTFVLTPTNLHLNGDKGQNDTCCVDKGVVFPSVTHDIDGQARPDGPAPDIGCDEI